MRWFKNRKTMAKLMLGFGSVLLIMIASGSLLFFKARNLRQNAEQLEGVVTPAAEASQGMAMAVVQVQQWLTDVSASGETAGLKEGRSLRALGLSMLGWFHDWVLMARLASLENARRACQAGCRLIS